MDITHAIILPTTEWEAIKQKLDEVADAIALRNKRDEEESWLESSQVRRELGISNSTWQTYRDERKIPFSQFGRKIYVKRADLNAFIESNVIGKRGGCNG